MVLVGGSVVGAGSDVVDDCTGGGPIVEIDVMLVDVNEVSSLVSAVVVTKDDDGLLGSES